MENKVDSQIVPLTSNLIYYLKSDNVFFNLLDKITEIEKPSPKLYQVIDIVANMSTELFFDKDYQLPFLVACGQTTMCYNLMKRIVRNYGAAAEDYPDDVK